MRVIGTAGHVDHGKSTLVQALTGTHPDRLKEERERAMTIDLGFAWFTLPGGEAVGVIDVPGHRDFIENMGAGGGGIDAALLVVAADEGVMPQTREHLAILDLLQIQSGVVALTKADLVDDDWLTLVTADLRAMLTNTVLAYAPIVPVSARSGVGLAQLTDTLQATLSQRPPRPDLGRPRLPIDRVFTLAGFGTVVTGTLSGGALQVGDEAEVYPAGLRARLRGLQTHKTKVERAVPGSRVAANLVGVEVNELHRGMVVAHPNSFQPTTLLDVRFRHLPDAELPLKHNAEIKFFLGAAEVFGTARLLESDALEPGEQAWVQLVLTQPVVAVKGDHFILRRPSPGATIGGGVIVDPHPKRRHKRRAPEIIAHLATLLQGTPGEILLQALTSLGLVSLKAALHKSGLVDPALSEALSEIRASGDLLTLDGETLVASRQTWQAFANELQGALTAYHVAHPLRAGMPREELKSRLGLASKIFTAALNHAEGLKLVILSGAWVRLPTHAIQFSPDQQTKIDALLADFQREPYNTPSFKVSAAQVGEDVLNALIELDQLISLSSEVLLTPETYASTVAQIKTYLQTHGTITVAIARDLLGTSRKYALALLEHLDAQGVTKRVGDERVLK